MNCTNCGAPLEEDQALCPVCGHAQADPDSEDLSAVPNTAPETERPLHDPVPEAAPETKQASGQAGQEPGSDDPDAAPEQVSAPADEPPQAPETRPGKSKKKGILLAAVAAVLVLALAAALLVPLWLEGRGMGASALTDRDSYTVSSAGRKAGRVAARMDGAELTNGQFQIFYWMEYYSFLNQFGSNLSLIGLSEEQPLSEQACAFSGENEMTWEQYFVQQALDTWAQFQSLALDADAAGFTLDDDLRAQLDNLPQQLADQATADGYQDAEEMVRQDFGSAASMDDYLHYMELYYTAYMFYSQQYAALDPTEEELSAYFDENAALFADSGVEKGESSDTINVRHILIAPEGGTQAEDGTVTYSEEEWLAAQEKARALLDQWKQGEATEDSFAALVQDNSADGGSSSNGGLYENVSKGQMVEQFDAWCFDSSRRPGDTDIVATKFGYHIMYFVGQGEPLWLAYARSEYLNEKSMELLSAPVEAHPAEVNYRALCLTVPTSVSDGYTASEAGNPPDTAPTVTETPTQNGEG